MRRLASADSVSSPVAADADENWSSNCEMSAPETNDFPPSPENTTMRTLSSCLAWSSSAGTAPHMSTESALCFAGLSKRMCRTGPSV